MDKPNLLTRIATRLRPELAELQGIPKASALLSVNVLLFFGPLGLIGLVWLVSETDLALVRQNGLVLLLTFLIGFLVNQNWFELHLQLRPGVYASTSGTLLFLVSVSALFIFGPSAYWISVFANLGYFLIQFRRDPGRDDRWDNLGTFINSLSNGVLPAMIGVWLYRLIGGRFPLGELTLETLWPALVFLIIYWLLPAIYSIPILIYITRIPELQGEQQIDKSSLILFFLVNVSVPSLALPFSLLGAAIYTLNGMGVFLFFLVGLLMVSYLASGLTKNANLRAHRARELGVLDELGRQIISAPLDGSTLSDILRSQLPGMFLRGRVRAWLEPDKILYTPENSTFEGIENIEAALRSFEGPYYELAALTSKPSNSHRAVALPIRSEKGNYLGGIYFDVLRQSGKIQDFIPALQSLAAHIASACYRAEAHQEALLKERMSNELELAGRIQSNFLPEAIPMLPGFEIAASLTPALQTSGDFYDFIPLPDGRLGVLIADVADKGTSAALFMALTRTLIRTYALEHPDDPARVFALTNARVHQDTSSQLFITTFYGIIHPRKPRLLYVNGGHNPPYLFNSEPDGEPRGLIRTGVPIGIFENTSWQSAEVDFLPGQTLVLYTDGVTEAQNLESIQFEEHNLIAAARDHLGSAEETHTAVIAAVKEFVGPAPQFDDLTLIVVRRQNGHE